MEGGVGGSEEQDATRSTGVGAVASPHAVEERRGEPTAAPPSAATTGAGDATAGPQLTQTASGLKVVIIGCCHGELDAMYESVVHLQQRENITVDLILCCGDFQAVRNMSDLNALACPQKYRRLNTFYKYYSGEMRAPIPTIFIGGNHEASNYLTELYYGGWVAPNIYFLGLSGVVNFGGLRIGGLSGIYKKFDYRKGHYELPPYSDSTMRSVYHVREFEVFKLMQLTKRLDVMLSHDWPRGIAYNGNLNKLLRWKPFLKNEIESGVFGSPPAEELLHTLQPEYWFSAHMHVKYPAVVRHPSGQMTKFLALDKVLPRRDFLQVWDFPQATGPKELSYDEEWLAIVRSTNHLLSFSHAEVRLPGKFAHRPTQEEIEWIRKRAQDKGNESLRIPHNFTPTAPAHQPGERGGRPYALFESPQRTAFLDLLELPDLFLAHASSSSSAPPHGHHRQPPAQFTQSAVGLSLPPPSGFGLPPPVHATKNEEEIELSLEDEAENDSQVSSESGANVGEGTDELQAESEDVGAKRRRIDTSDAPPAQESDKNAEEIELDMEAEETQG